MSHGHAHERTTDNQRRLRLVLILTTLYLAAEVVGGLWTGSLALLADAGHMLTDAGGIALALMGMKFAARPATPERTYGFHRAEILAALTNAVVLIGISLYVVYEAWVRFRSPPTVASAEMVGVAALGLVVNIAGLLILRGGTTESLNMKGAYFEVLSDLLASLAVLLAGAVMWVTGWYSADPLISAAIGLFILPRTWRLLREAVGVLLEGTPATVNLMALREAIQAVPGVESVHDLHVWSLTSGVNAMSVHVVRRDASLSDEVLHAVQTCVRSGFEVAHLTVQVEARGCEATEVHL
ncbi:cation diffusion facilitator family transporter [Pyxidicoccus sp. MSG2]|uniref:cation diffusion facilitator family transporter n=1 Tax=Pyxidicoccus sp. MSG2 TaxID=2996790 RepID=UPI00227049D3|nr:cation diffusion facilitator family transporter [Pyxidicoccus sp. MSG2]MCY1017877.1 cation diffusion facilitator family transporter [Pyxidicoccus sp. MSG2]